MLGPEQDQRPLRGDQADAPGGHDGVERTPVQRTDDDALHHNADQAGEERAAENANANGAPSLATVTVM